VELHCTVRIRQVPSCPVFSFSLNVEVCIQPDASVNVDRPDICIRLYVRFRAVSRYSAGLRAGRSGF
jgi:hypothetical protein